MVLPLLECATKYWDYPSLKNVAVIGVQHILRCTAQMFYAMEKLGLDLNQVFLLGKCYSSSSIAAEEMRSRGIYVADTSFSFDSYQPYDNVFKDVVTKFLLSCSIKIKTLQCEKIIILDDGGYLIKEIIDSGIFEKSNIELVGVEQTSSGFRALESVSLSFSVINVARSKPKLTLEVPTIINAFVDRLEYWIGGKLKPDATLLIIGKGPIGKGFLKKFKQHRTFCYDIRWENDEVLEEMLGQANIVIGCTGTTSIKHEEYRYLKKGAILASASSSDREFDAVHFRRQFPRTSDPHTRFITPSVTLLESGCPINFSGAPFAAPLNEIQLTLALLFSGVCQATTRPPSAGLAIVEPDCQQILSEAYARERRVSVPTT